jgi:hypothetical protein
VEIPSGLAARVVAAAAVVATEAVGPLLYQHSRS